MPKHALSLTNIEKIKTFLSNYGKQNGCPYFVEWHISVTVANCCRQIKTSTIFISYIVKLRNKTVTAK